MFGLVLCSLRAITRVKESVVVNFHSHTPVSEGDLIPPFIINPGYDQPAYKRPSTPSSMHPRHSFIFLIIRIVILCLILLFKGQKHKFYT